MHSVPHFESLLLVSSLCLSRSPHRSHVEAWSVSPSSPTPRAAPSSTLVERDDGGGVWGRPMALWFGRVRRGVLEYFVAEVCPQGVLCNAF